MNVLHAEERPAKNVYFWILHKIMEIILFSADIHQCIIALSIVHVQVALLISFI